MPKSPKKPKKLKVKKLPPDPDDQNDDRAMWADDAVTAFIQATRTDFQDSLCDLLADLMHWADRNGLDFRNELRRAQYHYEAETSPEGDGF